MQVGKIHKIDDRLLSSYPIEMDFDSGSGSHSSDHVIEMPAEIQTTCQLRYRYDPIIQDRWKRATARVTRFIATRKRWRRAARTVITMKKLLTYYELVKDSDPDSTRPRDRFYAVVQLSIYFKGEGDIPPKLLHVKRILQETSLRENMWDEATQMGVRFSELLTPSKMGQHIRWFTGLFTVLLIGVYSYMCADYRNYQGQIYGPHVGSALTETFDFDFLNTWRGFQGLGASQGQSSRWFVSIIEHAGLQHIVANLCLFLLVSGDLEHKYGTTRILFISFLAGVGGNLFSAVADDGCAILVGASGLIFGLVGFWIADLLINFHFYKNVLVKSLLAGAFFVFFIITAFSNAHVSNWCHLGGFLSGMFPSLLVLPRLGRQRLEAALTYVGLVGLILYFTILPVIAFRVVFPRLECGYTGP